MKTRRILSIVLLAGLALAACTPTTTLSGTETVTQGTPVLSEIEPPVATEAPVSPGPGPGEGDHRLAFVSNLGGTSAIFSIFPDGSELARISPRMAWIGELAWSPGGDRLAFVAAQEDTDASPFQIFIVNAFGSGLARLETPGLLAFDPVWSPDGSLLVFTGPGEVGSSLYRIQPDGSGLDRLTAGSSVDSEPAWSPDGQTIAFTCMEEGDSSICVVAPDGSGRAVLVPRAVTPRWSPDGAWLAFHSRRDLFAARVDGSDLVNLSNTPGADEFAFDWLPDSQSLAFVTNRDSNAEIYRLDRETGEQVNLTQSPTSDQDPRWSLDGAWIAYTADGSLYVMHLEGGEKTNLAEGVLGTDSFAWQP